MLLALMLVVGMTDWVPMRWANPDPKSLELVKNTPVNCLLLEQKDWTPNFLNAAHQGNLAVLGVIRPGAQAMGAAQQAVSAKLDGVVLEGDFDTPAVARFLTDSRIKVVELTARSRMPLESSNAVIGTYQGVWPGVQVDEAGATKAAPSGAAWIDTNTGFVRFVKAATSSVIWIGNRPPEKRVLAAENYLQAIADAQAAGARWVIALDPDLEKRLYAREARAMRDWGRITQQLAFYEGHKDWHGLHPKGQLALVEDVQSGALLSGGVLDMIAVKHTPVRPVPSRRLSAPAMDGTKMALDVDPSSLTQEQKEVLNAWRRAGNTLLTGPPGWKFPAPKPGQITLGDAEIKILDDIWKEMNSMTGRRNLGVRLFNVSSMLSNFLESADGKQTVLHLVNYSNFPVEAITVHALGKYKSAKLYQPDGSVKNLQIYESEDGTGIDVDQVVVSATVVLE